MPELTIAIAKGRLQNEALELLLKAGFGAKEIPDSRSLTMEDEAKQVRFIFVKPVDVPVYVEHGAADCGVVGRDVLLETEADLLQPLSLPIGACQMVIAAPAAAAREAATEARQVVMPKYDHTMLRVATKYPRVAGNHFGKRAQPVEIIELSESVELAPALGLADCILDLVQTGRTLRENGLRIVEVVAGSTGRLVVNRASYQLKAPAISRLITALRELPQVGSEISGK